MFYFLALKGAHMLACKQVFTQGAGNQKGCI